MDASRRVLILDDDPVVQMNLRAYLEDEGFTVLSATTGEDALPLLLGESSPDLVVFDIRLAGMSGEEFAIRARERAPGLRYLIHTASTEYAVPQSLADIGIRSRDVLIKPLEDMQALGGAIRRQFKAGDKFNEV